MSKIQKYEDMSNITSDPCMEDLAEQSDPEAKLRTGEVKLSSTPVLLRLFLEY